MYDISLALFVSGWLIAMEGEKPAVKSHMARHLQELIPDTELYGWDKARAFHAVWFQQLEHGRLTWEEAMRRSRWVLIWHPAMTTTMAPATAAPLPQKKQMRDIQAYNTSKAMVQSLPGI